MNEKKEIDNIQTQANGFPFKWAEKMMDQMEKEQNRKLFGREEKNLLCNYAYHAGNTPEVQAQIREVAASRFELQNGFVDPVVQRKLQATIKGIELKWSIAAGQKELHTSVRKYLKENHQGSTHDTRQAPNKSKNNSKDYHQRDNGR